MKEHVKQERDNLKHIDKRSKTTDRNLHDDSIPLWTEQGCLINQMKEAMFSKEQLDTYCKL